MNLQEIIEGLINSESNEGCASGFSVVQKKWVRKLEDYLEDMKQEEKEAKEKEDLINNREWIATRKFEESTNETLEIPDDAEVIDTDVWETDGDVLMIKFSYTGAIVDDPSLAGVFIVTFKKNSTEVIDVHSNT